jgi:hypothetical protein
MKSAEDIVREYFGPIPSFPTIPKTQLFKCIDAVQQEARREALEEALVAYSNPHLAEYEDYTDHLQDLIDKSVP